MTRASNAAVPALLVAFLAAACSNAPLAPPAGAGSSRWSEFAGNPVIRMGDRLDSILWNDPSVLRVEDGSYRMWLSGGDPRRDPIRVSLFTARSADGARWTIDPAPVLEPGPPGSWDSLRIETPSVVKVGSTYHLYYSGADERGAAEGVFAIGHATSSDGIRWRKDPRNPILRGGGDRHAWGFRGVGEPSAVYLPDRKVFRLYHVGMRFAGTDTRGRIGILLAESKDGSAFETVKEASGEPRLILTRDIPGAAAGSWFGYSTPSALLDPQGRTHLFVAFLVAPEGPATARHVTIDQAVSRDGLAFEVVQENLFEAGRGDWKSHQVRSPSAVWDGDRIRLWFAGEARRPHFQAGIGMAEGQPPGAAGD